MRMLSRQLFLLLFFCSFFLPIVAEAAVFNRDLSQGSRGSDVLALQQILNSDVRTRLAESGVGSPGQETTYYGPLTSRAVARYQEIYANDVLRPLGLSRGTGYFGPSTRAKMVNTSDASLSTYDDDKEVSESAPTEEFVAPATEPAPQSRPVIIGISPSRGASGTQVVIRGTGFDPANNTVDAGYATLRNVPSQNGTITITVQHPFPQGLVLPPNVAENIGDFQYNISVANAYGESASVVFTLVNSKIKEQSQNQPPVTLE